MSIKEQMIIARGHIQAGEYVRARQMLVGLDNPKAREWVTVIDRKLAAEERARFRRYRRLVWVIVVVAILLLVGGLLLAGRDTWRYELESRLWDYCRATSGVSAEDCGQWAQSHLAQAQACAKANPDLDAPFHACLHGEGIVVRQ